MKKKNDDLLLNDLRDLILLYAKFYELKIRLKEAMNNFIEKYEVDNEKDD